MPTYEYVCTDCENQWEEVQRISAPALEVCPKCGHSTAKRQISAGNFILKGGGWYADLYSSSPKAKASSESSDAGGSKSAESTTAAAPAAAAPAAAPAAAAPAASSGSSSGGGSSGGSPAK